MLIAISHTFPKILHLSDLEYLYHVIGFWSKINTLTNIILTEKIYDMINFDFSTSVIHFIFTDIRHTTILTYALLWDIFSIPNTVMSRGIPVLASF